jgi:tetratricopeptide (TPR) repeat protein
MKLIIGVGLVAAVLAGCALLRPPQTESAGYPSGDEQATAPSHPSGTGGAAPPAANASPPAPFEGAPPPPPPASEPRQFMLGPAAAALVGEARAQEQSRNFGIASETLERALSIEPHNPLVWIELGRENILAGNPAQAYGMGRKALYLATGDSHAQASAWELIAASLRAQGRNDEAYVAEEKAAALSPNL